MNKDNVISTLIGIIIGLIAAVVFTLRANNPRVMQTSTAPTTGSAAVPFSDLSHTNKETGGKPSGGGMQPQVRAALDAARDNPKDVRAQLNAAGMYFQIGQYEQAMPFVEQALAAEPENVAALTAAGDVQFEKGDFVKAAEAYERVLKKDPKNVNVRADLGSTYYQRTPPDYDRAIAEYRRALEQDPTHENSLQNLAVALLAKDDRAAARTVIEQLAAAHPTNPSLAELRANATR